MPIFCVTETQHVRYRWYVDADTETEAAATAIAGVPDTARCRLLSSDYEATAVGDPTVKPTITLERWRVEYRILSGIETPAVAIADATVVVRALDEDTATALAVKYVEDNDAYHDSRIDPRIEVVNVELVSA
jgi:hypothetical protein